MVHARSALAIQLLFGLVLAPAIQPQAPPADPHLPDQLKELKTLVADPKTEGDFGAIAVLQKLAQDLEKRNPKDLERIAKAIGEVFHTGKLRPMDKAHIYREAATALGKMGEDGAKELVQAVADARFKDREYVPLRALLIVEIGRTRDAKQVDWLLAQALRASDDDIMAAGGEALGFHADLELKKRRDVVRFLVRRYGEVHDEANAFDRLDASKPVALSPQDPIVTLHRIEPRWTATLTAMTGQRFTTFPDWQRWLKDNPLWVPVAPAKKVAGLLRSTSVAAGRTVAEARRQSSVHVPANRNAT